MISIALALAAAQAAPTPAPLEVEIVRDAITDRQQATAILRGAGERIVIRCVAPNWGDLDVSYHSRRWLARGNFLTGQSPITIRFDDGRPQRRLWHVRDRSANFDDRGRAIAFLRSLMGARRLVLRTRDVENHTFDSVFEIGDSTPAIVALLHTCGSRRVNPRIIGER
ncbi:MAG: Type secretion system VasI, EvfG [Sphingomonadales bacterium]|jgi:hypothetical protein|nr:Type secretion system VasI, EvfG [Sphingomonadales bacterium]MEA3042719.1 Type secretion system VasI, EvfG [Sphingomonadales bacterium]MEA3047140.1 Type secretion system VasI, EvfG [Sphingomonadales bacterium]